MRNVRSVTFECIRNACSIFPYLFIPKSCFFLSFFFLDIISRCCFFFFFLKIDFFSILFFKKKIFLWLIEKTMLRLYDLMNELFIRQMLTNHLLRLIIISEFNYLFYIKFWHIVFLQLVIIFGFNCFFYNQF